MAVVSSGVLRLRCKCTSLGFLLDKPSRQSQGPGIDFLLRKSYIRRRECGRSIFRLRDLTTRKDVLRETRSQATAITAEASNGLLPDEALAQLRQRGVTIWEFYYDGSSEAYGLGDYGEEVRALQGYLITTGHFQSEHGTTGYFGPDTQTALSNWQKENGVDPALGVWGPLSRDKYRQLVANESSRVDFQRDRQMQPAQKRTRSRASPPDEVLPHTASVSVSVPSKAPPTSSGLSFPQSLAAALVIVVAALLAVVLRPRKKVQPKKPPDAQTTEELNRARSMLDLDRTGGPQPGETKKQ